MIGILAAITIVSYSGIQKRAAEVTLASDLRGAATQMEMAYIETGSYPTTLPTSTKTSPKVSLTLKSGGGNVYSGLTSSQNGLLLYDTCQALLSEGVGARPSDNNDYISACTVYNKNQIHIEGWNGRDVNTPLSVSSLQTYVDSYAGGNIPEYKLHAQDFMDQLVSRFQAAGGQFSVTIFWDNWATSTNGGAMKPTMPAPTSSTPADPNTYCLDGAYSSFSDLGWYVTTNSAPQRGSCS